MSPLAFAVPAQLFASNSGPFDPGVSPNNQLPFYQQASNLVGGLMGFCILLCCAAVAIGVVILVFDKTMKSRAGQQIGIIGIVAGIIGIAIISQLDAGALWAQQLNLFGSSSATK